MTKEYKAKITYCIKPEHPDFKLLSCWEVGKEYEFEDIYRIADYYTEEDVIEYIKHDLRLVAGGGYNTKGIYGEEFVINGKKYS